MTDRATWATTTHRWAREVDATHVAEVRSRPGTYGAGGLTHLVLEVLAYADDEAADRRRSGTAVVTRHLDGSVSVTDDGRGTDTRADGSSAVRKPVMATRDVRFFGTAAASLPDGLPRHGISVVCALSRWLTHTNRRHDGSWTQRYEHGLPVTDLRTVPGDGTTGTTVHFLADATLTGEDARSADLDLTLLTAFAHLAVTVTHA